MNALEDRLPACFGGQASCLLLGETTGWKPVGQDRQKMPVFRALRRRRDSDEGWCLRHFIADHEKFLQGRAPEISR